ncbi:MAG TPA: hypothetical protein VFT74_02175, partial [Isosphaeraceae bacterium]|nr:hypothetical protein [Isosphaeraceae bacterium]
PLNLDLKRPQLRSHPYLQGLYLLLRTSGLARVEGTGSKARLVLDPFLKTQWDQLNPTERYFQLLEAWLRFARPGMIGEFESTLSGDLLFRCVQTWMGILKKPFRLKPKDSKNVYMRGLWYDFYLLALMDLFGLMKVETPRGRLTSWVPSKVDSTLFGTAVFALILKADDEIEQTHRQASADDDENEAAVDDEDEDDKFGEDAWFDDEESELVMPEFGLWQPRFQPYFPEWKENLTIPKPETREGTFVFRVSLGKVWREIAMPAKGTLDDLMAEILASVKFDFDHLYEFTFRDPLGRTVTVVSPEMEEGLWATEFSIGSLPLEPGQTMEALYDFGDCWKFSIKLVSVDPEGKLKKPKILKRHGKAPEQYPYWDE